MLKISMTQVVPVRNKTNVPEIIVAPSKGMIRINSKAGVLLGIKKGHNVAYFSTEAQILQYVSEGVLTARPEGGYVDADGDVHFVQHFIVNYKDVVNDTTSIVATVGKNKGIGAQVQFTNNTMWGALNGAKTDLKVYKMSETGTSFKDDAGNELMAYELTYVGTRDKSVKGEGKETTENAEISETPTEDAPVSTEEKSLFSKKNKK